MTMQTTQLGVSDLAIFNRVLEPEEELRCRLRRLAIFAGMVPF